MSDKVLITLELDEEHAVALAQFVKRVGWSEMRGCAVDDDEARRIRTSLYALGRELADAGYALR